ncbi:hypothetical protein SI65_02874 [Aspergillus cristatus]|uniref:Uncharacterized protein n=1 Tax=Aspergillus cristatus TaxID=573508 RepID=A0A1E3BM68_ASPCR|nr:hypothetical protein SI65_02874 [Aspergillus cristatus]
MKSTTGAYGPVAGAAALANSNSLRVQARDSAACQGCRAPKESVYHLLLKCRKGAVPRKALFKGLKDAGVPRPVAGERHPEARLFRDPRATSAILQFLRDTSIGARQTPEETQRQDEWGWEELEEAEQMENG